MFETVGGDLFDAALQCIAFEGRILPIGGASGQDSVEGEISFNDR